MKNLIKQLYCMLRQQPKVPKGLWRSIRFLEMVIYGGRLRERFLVYLLGVLHRSQFRREWRFFSDEPPHFYNHRWNGYAFTYGKQRNHYTFLRGFLASEVVREGDCLLEIGCGDGFFSNTFFSGRCRQIHAVDIDPYAIETAKSLNSNPKIEFQIMDAVRSPFPAERYDVIVWDGAIGHFSESDLSIILNKIVNALSPSGVFVGSESLGIDGSDHLQYFENEEALAAVFKPYFKHVFVRTAEYGGGSFQRREAYWRCANSLNPRHESTKWVDFAEDAAPVAINPCR